MPGPLLSWRERAIWIVCFLIASALLVVTRFTSSDPDSALYASLSAKLSLQPAARWIAPQWWGLWPEAHQTGYFREHPAGLFLIPAAMGRIGIPPEQASYVFGIGVALISLLLMASLVARVTSRDEGRAALVLLQLMPVALIFRIRDNHEYPMLLSLLASLTGLAVVNRSWAGAILIALGFAAGLLVKGVFVVLVLIAAGLWVAINPMRDASRARLVAACAISLACMAAVGWAYDAAYLTVTGERFWRAYWQRQLGPMQFDSAAQHALLFVQHLGFYVLRLLFHPAPWSLALVWAMWKRTEPRGQPPEHARRATETRSLAFALSFAAASVVMLSAASRFAERYAFSATYLIGAAGVVVACRRWPALRMALGRLEAAVPAAPAVVWLTLLVLRLALGPFLPRIGG
jgi:4-amino-4-deoxy-L-arabinose transferase-like glycosyltransferase